MSKISVMQASLLYKVTTRTIYKWIQEDGIKSENYLYDIDKLQKAYERRRALKHMKRFA